MRVVVADDHALVRQSIVKAVSSEPGLEVVAEVADGLAAIQAVTTHEPDLVVLDIAMPGKDGLAVAEQLKASHPQVAVLFLSMHDDDASLQRAVALGARGFVSKSASIDELLDALRAMREGRSYLSSGVATRVMEIAAGRSTTSDLGLTAREREILGLLAEGRRPGEIAEVLFLSVKTVKNHLTAVYQKLSVETGAQAVAEAYRLGLVRRA
jgi:DNA-binding NarL/FixJ family response regulator